MTMEYKRNPETGAVSVKDQETGKWKRVPVVNFSAVKKPLVDRTKTTTIRSSNRTYTPGETVIALVWSPDGEVIDFGKVTEVRPLKTSEIPTLAPELWRDEGFGFPEEMTAYFSKPSYARYVWLFLIRWEYVGERKETGE